MTKNPFPLLYNEQGGGIFIVIYVDVLFIINFFITFLLLEITAKFTKKTLRLRRLIPACALGGAYSLVILINDLPFAVSFVSKALAAAVIVACAFSFHRAKSFALACGIFFFSALVLLGVVIGICLLFHTKALAVRNGSVYFDIGAGELLLSGLAAYLLSSLFLRIYNRRLSARELYTLQIEGSGGSITLFAMADTGNKLREPFSDAPVIVVAKETAQRVFAEEKARMIPTSTVNSVSLLPSFKPQRVIIKTDKGKEVVENVYVALSDDMNHQAFSAVFNPEILSV